LTLAAPASTFGFEIEPANSATFTETAITRAVTGDSGALLFVADAGSGGFVFAQFRAALSPATATTAPALSTSAVAGLGMALLAGGALLARKQNLSA
jgi:hypothetical protein